MKKKILIGFCIFFVIALIGGYIFLRSSFFTGKLHLAMESVLQKRLGREVSVGKVTGNVFGSISIAGISVAKDKKLSDGKLVEIEDVAAGYSLLSLLKWRFVIKSVRVARPRIWLERDAEGKLNLPEFAAGGEGRKSWFSVLVSNVDILSGEIAFDDRTNSIHSVVKGINGRLKGLGGEMEYSGEIRAQEIELDFGTISKTISNLASSFETSKEGLELSDLQFQLGRSHLQAKGEITGWDKPIPHESPQVSAEVRSKVFLEDVSEFLQGRTQGLSSNEVKDSPLRLDGVAEIYGAVNGKMPDLAGICRIDLPSMRVNDLEIQNVNAEVKFTQDTISLTGLSADVTEDGTGNGQAPNLSLRGMVQLADGRLSKYDGALNMNNLDIGGIITGLNGSQAGMPVPLSGYLSGEVSANGTELRPGSIDLDARFSMLDVRFPSLYPPRILQERTVLEEHDASSLSSSGLSKSPFGKGGFRGTSETELPIKIPPNPPLRKGGTKPSVPEPRIPGEYRGVQHPASSIEASLSVEGESIALNASWNGTGVELEGKLNDDGELDLSIEMDRLDLGEITSLLTGSPSIIGQGRISADASMKITDSRFRAGMSLPPVEGQRAKGEELRAESEEGRRKREEGKSEKGRGKDSMLPGIANLRAMVSIDMPDLRLPVGNGDKGTKGQEDKGIFAPSPGRSAAVLSSESGVLSPESIRIGSLTGTINVVDDRLRVDEMVLQLGESKCLVVAEVQIKDAPLIDARLNIDSLQIDDYLGLVWEPDKSGNYIVGAGRAIVGEERTQDSGRTQGLSSNEVKDSPLRVSGGVVNGELAVHGESTDMNGRGEFSITGLSVGHRGIDPISVPIEIGSSILTIPSLVLSSAGEQITAAFKISPSGDFNLKVDSSLIDLSKLSGQFSDLPLRDAIAPEYGGVSGAAQISLSGGGNISSPSLHGKLTLNRLGYKGEDFGDGECSFALRDERLHVDVSLLEQTLIATLDGSIQHPFPFNGIIQLGNVDLEPALNLAGLGEKIYLHITGSIDVDGEGADPMSSSVDAIYQTVVLDAAGRRWMNDGAIRFGFSDGRAQVSQARMRGAGGRLSVKGGFDIAGAIDLDVAVEDLDLAAISGLLDLPEPVSGRMDLVLRMDGDISSPTMEMALDASGVSYDQVDVDGISTRISYEKGMMEVKKTVFNTFGGQVRLGAMLPLDLDLRNLPTPDQLTGKSIYVSLDAEDLDLSSIPLFVPQVLRAGGKVDDVHLEMTGPMVQPKIGGSLRLKDAHFQVASLPAPIEDLNGSLSVDTRRKTQDARYKTEDRRHKTHDAKGEERKEETPGLESRVLGLESLEYEASLKLSWEMEKGRYDAGLSILDAGSSMLDAWHRVLGVVADAKTNVEHQISSNIGPDFQFDLEVQDGQLGSLVKEMAKDPLLPFDGNFSGKLHLESKGQGARGREGEGARERGSEYTLARSLIPTLPRSHAPSFPRSLVPTLHDLRGDLMIASLDLAVNGYKVKDRGQVKISLTDGTVEILDFRLMTLSPPFGSIQATDASSGQIGSIVMSGKVSLNDWDFGKGAVPSDGILELNLSGERLHPGLFSFLLYKPMGPQESGSVEPSLSGDVAFDIHAEGKLDSPAIELSLSAKDLSLPIPSANGKTEIDRILFKTSYAGGILSLEEAHVDTFGNSLDVNGTLPVNLSLMPFEVDLPDREMDLKMVMDNFNLAFLEHLADEVRVGALYITPLRGNIEADVRMRGSLKDPRPTGKFQLSDGACRLMVAPLKASVQTDIADELQPIEIRNIGLNVAIGNRDQSLGDRGALIPSDSSLIPLNPVSSIQYNMTFQIGEGQYESHGSVEIGQGLEPQLFDLAFKAAPAKIDPFLHLVGQGLTSSISGEITVDGQLKGDVRDLRGKPNLDALKTISGELVISDEGIKINTAGQMITNPKRIYAKLQDGKLDLPSLKLIHKTSVLGNRDQSLGDRGVLTPNDYSLIPPARTSGIAAFGFWEIGGEMSFNAIVDIDMGLVSELIASYASRVTRYGWVQPDLMSGWLQFKVQARGQEVQCLWPPASAGATDVSSAHQEFRVGHATIDRFEGKVIYTQQGIYVERVRISSGENHVILSGNMPMLSLERPPRTRGEATGKEMELRLDARLNDMGILSFINKNITESSGRGLVGATITGDIKKVMAKEEPIQFAGFSSFDGLDMNFDRSYIKFEDLKANIEFEFNSERLGASNKGFIALKALSGKMNDGEFVLDVDQTVKPGAEIIWKKETGYKIGGLRDISIQMSNCRLYSPMVYSMLFDGRLTLKGKFDAPIITGNVIVDNGEYSESLEDLVQRLLSSREIGFRAFLNYPLVQDLELDVSVQVPGDVRMNNSLAVVEAKAAAKVRGSLSKPVVLAQAHIDGKFTYFAREFAITEGQITNRSRIDPEYNITAQTEITNTGDFNIDAETLIVQMQLKGSLSERLPPTFTVSGGGLTQGRSSLSQRDIIAILTLGSTPEAFLDKAISGGPSPLLVQPAKWYLEAKAEQLLDLKEFQIQRSADASKETRVVIAKQLMDEISVTADVGSVKQWIGLQYEMRKHFALGGEVNRAGEWDFDLKIKWDFP